MGFLKRRRREPQSYIVDQRMAQWRPGLVAFLNLIEEGGERRIVATTKPEIPDDVVGRMDSSLLDSAMAQFSRFHGMGDDGPPDPSGAFAITWTPPLT